MLCFRRRNVVKKVTLIATSPKGCKDTADALLCMEEELSVYIPNSFTPNGDGRNDLFFPVPNNACYHINEFTIYNRWGEEEYIRTNAYPGWDGNNKFGEKCQMGEYVYIVKAECDGKEDIFKGSVLLIR